MVINVLPQVKIKNTHKFNKFFIRRSSRLLSAQLSILVNIVNKYSRSVRYGWVFRIRVERRQRVPSIPCICEPRVLSTLFIIKFNSSYSPKFKARQIFRQTLFISYLFLKTQIHYLFTFMDSIRAINSLQIIICFRSVTLIHTDTVLIVHQ